MKKIVFSLMTAFCLVLIAGQPMASAQETIWEMANSEQYGKKAGGMLGRGLLNAATCFVDLIVQTVEGTQDGPPFVGTLTGLGSGIGCTALRATSGVLDVATFWVPGFNGFPVSRSYSNCLEVADEEPASALAPDVYNAPDPGATPVIQPQPVAVKQDPSAYVKK